MSEARDVEVRQKEAQMFKICSIHQARDPDCHICRVSPPSVSNIDARLGFLEGVMIGFQFVETYEEFREALERANKRYREIRGQKAEGEHE